MSVLTLRYQGGSETPALKDVSFSLAPGEKAALIGADGAGKSSLLLCIAGLLPPTAGTVRLGTSAPGERTATLVMQNPDDQLFMPTVYDDAAFGPRNYGVPEDEIARRIDAVLAGLGIPHLKPRLTSHLSGGEKRLAALAGVLVLRPSLLLLDEPSSFLDPRSRRRLLAVLRDLPQALLVATHDLDLASSLCERTLVLSEGALKADVPTADILGKRAMLEEWGL
ncbi:MAG: energy-coupling factor ABC transporter ATP-binding protein [Spirochaetaceae bacterium]|nr:energy-coupling factor ABC transporter ATP-binding protein [Spirochaetaceae bacterium]